MSYEIIKKAESFKENSKEFMNISKELLNAALKDSMSIGYLASLDAESLAMIGKLNDALKVCEEMIEDFCDLEKEMSEQISKLDKLESINTKLGELKALDSKLDRIEKKLDRLEDNKK